MKSQMENTETQSDSWRKGQFSRGATPFLAGGIGRVTRVPNTQTSLQRHKRQSIHGTTHH